MCIDADGTPWVGSSLSSRLEDQETDWQDRSVMAGRLLFEGYTPEVAFRHSGWNRNRTLVARSLARTRCPDSRLRAFTDCGSDAWVLRSIEDPTRYRITGSYCHDRWCQPCATGRATTIAGNVLDVVRDRDVKFLTLTLRGNPSYSLKRQLDKLYDSFAQLRRRTLWTHAVLGGVAFIELKWSERSAQWHPHLHCLIESSWIDKRSLKETWYHITADSFVVDIRRPKSDDSTARYVTKYASKPLSNTFANREPLLDEAVTALNGRKLALTFGTWRGLQLTALPDEGCWEQVATLSTMLAEASRGNDEARGVLANLYGTGIESILALVSPVLPRPPPPTPDPQLILTYPEPFHSQVNPYAHTH